MGLPLLAPIISGLVDGLVGAATFTAVNNYISKNSASGGSAPVIPTSRRSPAKSSKTLQKESLSSYATGVGGVLAAAAAVVGSAVSSGKNSAESASTAQTTKTSELLTTSGASPLLTNQVYMKDSIDKLIDAINANTLVSASVFGTLDANMSAIGSSLTSISATLIEVADNYKKEISNTDDLPYINQEDYYNMLKEGGMSFSERNDLIRQEDMFYDSLVNAGYDYDDIKAQIQNWRKYTVPISGQFTVEKELAGISKSSPLDSNGNVSYPDTITFPDNLNVTIERSENEISLTDKNLEKVNYELTPTSFSDIHGNDTITASPIELVTMKNIGVATSTALENSTTADELGLDDFNDSFDLSTTDILKLFTFNGISDNLTAISRIDENSFATHIPDVNLK